MLAIFLCGWFTGHNGRFSRSRARDFRVISLVHIGWLILELVLQFLFSPFGLFQQGLLSGRHGLRPFHRFRSDRCFPGLSLEELLQGSLICSTSGFGGFIPFSGSWEGVNSKNEGEKVFLPRESTRKSPRADSEEGG
ncbi:hypothetical protein PIB30_021676 [Stylosanthes scabra]|uniref:Uncharacterized protein n=1 Tax=Stylosanthes scabra TaxID=79078 RepID=A0ABU6Z5R4_9FABA|nr:hypothetical protein [Stylosanthes scabra]